MRLLRTIACIIVLFMAYLPSRGGNIMFSHIGTNDGLSQFSVNALYVDENGLIWIGTRDGLNCYDGEKVQTFLPKKDDPGSILGNNILRIDGNRNGKLYILCSEGLCEYDMATERFDTLLEGEFNSILYKGALFVSKKNEIYRINTSTGNFDLYFQLGGKNQTIKCMYLYGDTFYVGTQTNGVYVFGGDYDAPAHPIPTGNITNIYEDRNRNLWIGSWEEGLYRIAGNGTITNFRHDASDPSSISSDFVRCCCEDNLGTLWAGTFNGLNSYDERTGKFTYHTTGSSGKQGLTHSSIWCLVKDGQGTMWLGTYFGGVNWFNPEYDIYTRYTSTETGTDGLSSPVIGRIIEGRGDDLWIATEGGGINLLDRRTGRFRWMRHSSSSNSISHDNVKALYYDDAHNILWIGTHLGGLNQYDAGTGRFTAYRHDDRNPESIPSDIVRDIFPYRDRLILGTQKGVCMFDPATGKSRMLISPQKQGLEIGAVSDIYIDKSGCLWTADENKGVFRYGLADHSLDLFSHISDSTGTLSNNKVNEIMQDSMGRIWLATAGGGLDLFDPLTKTFTNFDTRNSGLGSDCIYSVRESPASGNILLVTNNSFCVLDPSSGEFKNYDRHNGFPFSALNENSLCITKGGEVYLGGIEGMISFNEAKLQIAPKPYRILLRNIFVKGEPIVPDGEDGILREALYRTGSITLKSWQNMFTVEFAAPNSVEANRDDIIYKLEGFSKDWSKVRGEKSITFTNLNAGHYRLIIKASGKPDALCTPAVLDIRVLPPFYKSVWAYLIYSLTLVLLFLYMKRVIKSRIRIKEHLRYEKKHLADIEALNQSKLRFFTNISHEFRTPLTLIVAEIEALMQGYDFTPDVYSKILNVYKNSQLLRELITELLDFRKAEQGHLRIHCRQQNLTSFLYENFLLFEDMAKSRNIGFSFVGKERDIEVWFDRRQMQKVINNLISNAFKHTPGGGSIKVGIREEHGKAVFSVKDSGEGIGKEDLDRIFERFYQVERPDSLSESRTGTGIGLALTKGIVELHHGSVRAESEPGNGAKFIVELPLGRDLFDDSQIDSGEAIDNQNIPDGIQTLAADSNPSEPAHNESTTESPDNQQNTQIIPTAKLLVVEDNTQLREMLAGLFSHYYAVASASDGEEGWKAVQDLMPDIVVSDVVMPKMSGLELCKRIKTTPDTCHIPVVLLTARVAVEQNIEGLKTGADDYITKPFSANLLIARCNNLINSRVLLQEKFSRQPQSHVQILATNPMDKQMLDKAVLIINSHLDDPDFNVNVFAAEMAMSRTNLFAKIKAVTGQTPNDFILTMRLKTGAVLLRSHPEMSVAEVSDHIGFSSPRYFSKCFKDVYNLTPLAYRNGPEA